jgi:peptide deformylase
MSEILSIAQLGEPILRQRAQEINDLRQPHIQRLIDDLIKTVKSAQGVGIAAPQVDLPYRLIIVASRPNSRYPKAPKMTPTPMINPEIMAHSDELVKDWEGCLSVPGVRGLVPRYREIEIKYLTRKGKVKTQVFGDFVARICQHEIDHLEGIVFTDRVETEAELITEEEYQKLVEEL